LYKSEGDISTGTTYVEAKNPLLVNKLLNPDPNPILAMNQPNQLNPVFVQQNMNDSDLYRYLRRSRDYTLQGDYAEDFTLLGLAGNVGVSFIPYVGQVADVRDLSYTLSHTHEHSFWGNVGLISVSLLGFIPGIGNILKGVKNVKHMKHVDKIDDVVTGIAKNNKAMDIIKKTDTPGSLSFNGKHIDSLDGLGLSQLEKKTWTDLLKTGNDIDLLPVSNVSGVKTSDSYLNGVKVELKAMEGSNPNTAIKRIEQCFEKPNTQHGLIDVRNGTMTPEQAQGVIESAVRMNKIPDGGNVVIWTNGGFVSFP
jgi:hypothetical protein